MIDQKYGWDKQFTARQIYFKRKSQGKVYRVIAQETGLSIERVRQIVARYERELKNA